MKNIWFVVLTGITLVLTSCPKDDPETGTVYTVSFETRGGSSIPSQKVKEGDLATAPSTNPVKAGYEFVFWHLEGTISAYNFQTPVTGDITLFAKWSEEATAEYWQVTWNLNGGAWPSEGDNHAVRVVKGGTLAEPAPPVRSGHTFEGWYKEAALTDKISFPYDVNAVTGNFTLYARWENENGGETTAFTIRNTSEWNSAVSAIKSGGNDKSYTLAIEGTVSVPSTTGVEQGKPSTYTFGSGDRLSVTLTGSGTLSLSNPGFLICLSGYVSGGYVKQKLIIDGPTLQGRSDNTVPLLRFDYADLELINGKITGNTNNGGGGSGSGGGVYIRYGRLTMLGGEISNNTCGQSSYAADGGGADLASSSFIMSGGIISGNTGDKGGGVYIRDANFSMTGGIIKGNTARSSSPYGGGVYYSKVPSGGYTFSKTGGIIYGSDADEADKNRIVHNGSLVYDNHGAAVYCSMDIVIGNSKDRRREKTLHETDNASTGEDTGWGL